jgi:protocatechuate 3,4-dioxygenase beta subunit
MKRPRNLQKPDQVRRALLQTLITLPAVGLAHCGGDGDSVAALSPTAPIATTTTTTTTVPTGTLPTTPACADDDDDPTPAQTEGPYFKPSSPLRTSLLEAGMAGTRLVISGQVLTTTCVPVAHALLDFWQADNAGAYDNSGFRLRGHQFTDANGRFSLETIVPGLYPGRTRHIHVKVQAPNQSILTTQLYFPGEARNASDGIYSAELLLAVVDGANGKDATFNFVVRTA